MFGKIGNAFASGGLSLIPGVDGFMSDPLGHGSIGNGMADQGRATADANAKLEKMYNEQRADYEPWSKAGTGALDEMGSADFKRDFKMSDFQEDPGYAFRMAEGQKALERSAAARGGLNSGATMKALSRYGQDFASNEYGNAYNRFNSDRDRRFGRLSSIANLGYNATAARANASMNYGNQYSNNVTGLGNAYAAGHLAKANSNQQMMSGLMTMGSKAAAGGAKAQPPSQATQSAPTMSSYWDKNPYS